jgi:primosomal protein N''
MTKNANRQVYIRRIMDVVKNVDKQKAQLAQTLGEVKRIQKDLSVATESVQKSSSALEDMMLAVCF